MRIAFWAIGKPHDKEIKASIEEFTKRISRYRPVEWQVIPNIRQAASLSANELKLKEGEVILRSLWPDDYLVALDERGKQLTSVKLAAFLNEREVANTKSLVFLIGGAFGLAADVLKRSNFTWSLSDLTFPHQLVRLILAEQIYRGYSILQNEKYHHE